MRTRSWNLYNSLINIKDVELHGLSIIYNIILYETLNNLIYLNLIISIPHILLKAI